MQAFGERDGETAFVCDEEVSTPFLLGGVVAVVEKFEPAVAGGWGCVSMAGKRVVGVEMHTFIINSRVNLLQVYSTRTLMP